MLVVLLFHGEIAGFSGGYLGVSVFFTLSGYLITSLLIAEHAGTGRSVVGAVLRPPGQAPAAGQPGVPDRRSPSPRRRPTGSPASAPCAATCWARCSRWRTGSRWAAAARTRSCSPTPPARRRRSSTTGRWRSRSSSTGCGRWPSSGCAASPGRTDRERSSWASSPPASASPRRSSPRCGAPTRRTGPRLPAPPRSWSAPSLRSC